MCVSKTANYGVGGCGTGEKTGKCLNLMMKGKSAERHDEERLIEEKRCLLLNKSDKNSICNNLILLLECAVVAEFKDIVIFKSFIIIDV